jgi:WD40 repeat protein
MTTFHPYAVTAQAYRDCPYVGLQPYGEADSEFFFGRDEDRDLIIANLMASRLTVLYGPSGVGKSSLLQAGVLPHLRHGSDGAFSYVATSQSIVVYHSSWRDDPLVGLADSLRDALRDEYDRDTLVPAGPLNVEVLRNVADRLDADIYLLCDQFEEEALYLDGRTADAFAVELGRIIGTPGLRVNVLLGVREDALAKLDRLEAYVPDLFSNGLRLNHLTAEGAREAIERPLSKYSHASAHTVGIEPGLVRRLLDELRTGHVLVSDGAGASQLPSQTIETPFLQLVMTKLWFEEMAQGSSVLRESTLLALGGSDRIVRTHLDDVMCQLTERQRAVAAEVFRFLVTPSGVKVAHTAEDLAAYAGIPDARELVGMLEDLASSRERVLRPIPPPPGQDGAARYEIFHDVMAPAILDWRRRYAAEQERSAAEATLAQTRRDAEAQQRRTRRRLRRSQLLSAFLCALLVVTVAGFVYARRLSDEAEAGRRLAEYEQLRSIDPAGALHAALGSWNKRHSPQAEAAVRTALDADNRVNVLHAHSGMVTTSQFAPDGHTILTTGNDGTAKLFDASTGRQLRVLTPPGGTRSPLQSGSFSPDGAMVATAAADGTVRVYSTDGRSVNALTTFKKPVMMVWVTRGSRELLLISSTGQEALPAQLWDPQRGATIARFGSSDGALHASASPDGRYIVAVDAYASITVWDALSAKPLAHSVSIEGKDSTAGQAAYPHFVTAKAAADRIAVLGRGSGTEYLWELVFWDWHTVPGTISRSGGRARFTDDLAISHDGKLVAMVADKHAVVYDVSDPADASPIGLTAQQPDGVDSVEFSADGQWLLSANVDGHGTVWLAREFNSKPVTEFVGHRGEIFSARFSPADPTLVITAGLDGTVRIWKFNSAKEIHPPYYGWITSAEVSTDGAHIVTAQDTGNFDVWDAHTYRHVKGWNIQENTSGGLLLSAQFLKDNTQLATATYDDDRPRIWNWAEGTQPTSLQPVEGYEVLMSGAALNQDRTRIAAGDSANRVVEWDLSSGKIVSQSTGSADGFILSVAYIPHSDLIIAGSTNGSVRIWHSTLLDKAPLHTLIPAGSRVAMAVTASADGSRVAAVDSDHVIRIWRVSDGQVERLFHGPASTMSALTFDSSGALLAVSAADAAIHIYDTSSGHPVATLQRHGDVVNSVRFTTDNRLLTGSDDGTAAVFTCETCQAFSQVLKVARQRDGS